MSLFKKGFVSESAVVIAPNGKSITVGEFARRLDEQIASSSVPPAESAEVPPAPGVAQENEEELVELEAIEDTGPPPEDKSVGRTMPPPPVPVVETPPEFARNVFQPADSSPADSADAFQVEPARRTRQRTKTTIDIQQQCAFPGSVLGGLTEMLGNRPVRSIGPRIALNGLIEGIMYCVSFAALATLMLRQTINSGQNTSFESFLQVLISVSLLGFVFVTLHFLNTRLIQCQPRFFQIEYRVLDKVFMQAFLIAQTLALIMVALTVSVYVYQSLTASNPLQARSSGLSADMTKIIYVVALVGVFYRGSSLTSLGLRQDPSATPTETFLACVMAGLRMPLLLSGWLHLLGVICLTLNALYIFYVAFAPRAQFSTWSLSLMPLAIVGVAWPLLSTVLAMVGGTVVEILRAILSIERSVSASTATDTEAPKADPFAN